MFFANSDNNYIYRLSVTSKKLRDIIIIPVPRSNMFSKVHNFIKTLNQFYYSYLKNINVKMAILLLLLDMTRNSTN